MKKIQNTVVVVSMLFLFVGCGDKQEAVGSVSTEVVEVISLDPPFTTKNLPRRPTKTKIDEILDEKCKEIRWEENPYVVRSRKLDKEVLTNHVYYTTDELTELDKIVAAGIIDRLKLLDYKLHMAGGDIDGLSKAYTKYGFGEPGSYEKMAFRDLVNKFLHKHTPALNRACYRGANERILRSKDLSEIILAITD